MADRDESSLVCGFYRALNILRCDNTQDAAIVINHADGLKMSAVIVVDGIGPATEISKLVNAVMDRWDKTRKPL